MSIQVTQASHGSHYSYWLHKYIRVLMQDLNTQESCGSHMIDGFTSILWFSYNIQLHKCGKVPKDYTAVHSSLGSHCSVGYTCAIRFSNQDWLRKI